MNLYIQANIFTTKVFYDKKIKKHIFAISYYGEGVFFYDMNNFSVLGRLIPRKIGGSLEFDIIFDDIWHRRYTVTP